MLFLVQRIDFINKMLYKEIKRHNPNEVIILGGTSVVPDDHIADIAKNSI